VLYFQPKALRFPRRAPWTNSGSWASP